MATPKADKSVSAIVNVKLLGSQGSQTFKLSCHRRITVGKIKERIFGEWELPLDEQVLIFRGQKVHSDDRAQPLNTPDLAEIIAEAGENGLQMSVLHKPRQLPDFLRKEGLEDVNSKRPTGATALHRAARQCKLTVMEELLEDGDFTEVNALDNAGQTALHAAVMSWNREASEILLKSGKFISSNARDRDGRTALHIAACWGDAKVVGLILEHAAFELEDVAAEDASGHAAYSYAVDCGHEDAADLIAKPLGISRPRRRRDSEATEDSSAGPGTAAASSLGAE